MKNADANTDTDETSGESGDTPIEITESTRLDTVGALSNGGKVLKTVKLNDLEKLPSLIEDRLAQSSNTDPNFEPMTLISQFRVYSGPNVHSEEGADPYSWVICGSRGPDYGEAECGTYGGAIDASGATFAIVYNAHNQNNNLGDSVLARFGRDLNPARSNALGNAITSVDPNGDPDQSNGVYVQCSTAGPGGGNCVSDPGSDGMYGTFDDGTIYYREAIENGLRGWIRETNSHTFSFLGADDDGTHNGISPANFGLTQLVEQATEGFLMSCLNCSPHSLPAVVETVNYTVDWPAVPNVLGVNHPPDSGTFSIIP